MCFQFAVFNYIHSHYKQKMSHLVNNYIDKYAILHFTLFESVVKK